MITAQTHCRGAAQFLLCKNTTSRVGKYCAVHCAYTAWLSSKQVRAVGGASPYTFVSTVCPPQNHCRSLRILLCIRNYKSGAEICSPTPLCFGLQLCTSSFIILHRLVGLRLLRLCLKLRQGFAHFL